MGSDFEIDDANNKKETLNPKDRGLGRGLGALFGDDEDVYPTYDGQQDTPSEVSKKTIGIEKLFPCPTQPRRKFNEQAVKELSDSIMEHGLLQPIVVRPDKTRDGMYEIIAGERRWRACQRAQLHDVPITIKDLDDAAAFQIALIENIQREDLNAIEEAMGYNRLIEEFGHTSDSVAEAMGKSRSHIANMIRLLQLPASIQDYVVDGKLSAGHGRALLKADDPSALAKEVMAKNLSVRETEKLVAQSQGRAIQHREKNKKAGFSDKDADTLALEKEVSNQLGMNVSIDMADAHKGKMTINFTHLDQLDDILQRLAHRPKY